MKSLPKLIAIVVVIALVVFGARALMSESLLDLKANDSIQTQKEEGSTIGPIGE